MMTNLVAPFVNRQKLSLMMAVVCVSANIIFLI